MQSWPIWSSFQAREAQPGILVSSQNCLHLQAFTTTAAKSGPTRSPNLGLQSGWFELVGPAALGLFVARYARPPPARFATKTVNGIAEQFRPWRCLAEVPGCTGSLARQRCRCRWRGAKARQQLPDPARLAARAMDGRTGPGARGALRPESHIAYGEWNLGEGPGILSRHYIWGPPHRPGPVPVI